MKRLVLAALAAALLTGTGAIVARAHDDDGPESEHAGPPMMGEKMKEKLGLTDDQAAKLKDAMKAHGEAMKPLHEKMHGLLKKLHEQVEEKASDADLKATLDELKAQRKTVMAEEETFHGTLAGFLTPTQQAKMVLGMMHRMHERMERMHGRRGHHEDDGEDAHKKDKGDESDD